ncbi:hypothetical protein [Pseudoalteromonas spongiae]|uniref:AAA+ ATPase domain-containing protein n=1 Tax=Pseudoalteromonas spongiae TaxID=298657 RepID=A0ABU8ES51_9GAMM
MSNSENAIILNLEMATDVVNLKYDQVFQTEARKTIFDKIQKQLSLIDKGDKNYDELFYERYHNAITVTGPRGSGKSTFLRHILSCLEKPEKIADEEHRAEIPKRLSVLRIIDPTLISSKEHVLIILISQIRDIVNKSVTSTSSEEFKKYEAALRDLAGGLCQIDGIGASKYGAEWEDKTYILEKGLEKATDGRNLERNLNSFIDKALGVIDKDAFVVTFDDIDTQFERGWPVLETVRKYLTSDRWVVLISGDIELYSVLVKSAQYKSLGKEIMRYERASSEYHKNENMPNFQDDHLVAKAGELEEQYLMKVLKPENRVNMLTLHQKAMLSESKSNLTNIQVVNERKLKSPENLLSYPLEKVLDKFLSECLAINHGQEVKSYYAGILSLPTRTLLQLIKSIAEDLELGKNIESFTLEEFKAKKAQFTKLSNRVISIFSSSFARFNISQADLQVCTYSNVKLARVFWDWAIKNDYWKDINSLNVGSDDESLNARILTFKIMISNKTKFSISDAFQWMVFTGFPLHLALNTRLTGGKFPDKELILDYVGIGERYQNLIQTTQRSLVYKLALDESKTSAESLGLLTVPGSNEISLLFETNLERFYSISALAEFKNTTINKAPNATEKKKARAKLKRAYHHGINEIIHNDTNYKEFNALEPWIQGISEVYKQKELTSLESRTIGLIYNTIDSVNEIFDLGHLINLARVSVKGIKKSSETNLLSAITLLSAIFELKNVDGVTEETIAKSLFEILPQVPVLPPKLINGGEDNSEEEDENEDTVFDESEYKGEFYSNLYKWLCKVDEIWPTLAISNNSLTTLFLNFIENISELKQGNAIGESLHSQIVLFLHYCLIEDANRENYFGLATKGLNNTEKELHQNIRKYFAKFTTCKEIEIKKQRENFIKVHKELLINPKTSIFGLILACPIIGVFLQRQPLEKSTDQGWDWIKAHASAFIQLTSDNEKLHDAITSNSNDAQMLPSLNSVAGNDVKTDEYLATHYHDFMMEIEQYSQSIKVQGKIDDVSVQFENLSPILNSIPLTSLTTKQQLEIKLELDLESDLGKKAEESLDKAQVNKDKQAGESPEQAEIVEDKQVDENLEQVQVNEDEQVEEKLEQAPVVKDKQDETNPADELTRSNNGGQ